MTIEQPGKFAHCALRSFRQFVRASTLHRKHAHALLVHGLTVFLLSQAQVGKRPELMKFLLTLLVAGYQGL